MDVPNSTQPAFVVLSLERPEGERFAILHHNDWMRAVSASHSGSPATLVDAIEQFVRALELLTEDSLRERLEDMGVRAAAVADHITRARRIRQMNRGGTWERVTAPGYRNEEGQIVIARTDRTGGEPEQRVFEMRCSVCDHRYGAYGSDIPHRCCPQCQDGPPGIAV
jgi:hypothetical protein